MKATIVQQPSLRLITSRSNHFPEGNQEAMQALESRLETLRKRRFYGLAYGSKAGITWFAGLAPEDDREECRFAELGFPIQEIDGGTFARMKMLDWTSKVDQIGPTFGVMISEFGIDPSRPQIEYYRSHTELHLLLPIGSA